MVPQILTAAERLNADMRMVWERNRIIGKSIFYEGSNYDVSHISVRTIPKNISASGQLVIKEGVEAVGTDEVVRRLEAVTEHQLKEGSLLDFTINLKEPEIKKRKYKNKVSIVEEVKGVTRCWS